MVDYNRTSNGSVLPTPVAKEFLAKARDASLVMTKANQKTLVDGAAAIGGAAGVSGSKFVGETERKPIGAAEWSEKVLRAKKIALTLSFSTEFMRDKRALYQALVNDMSQDLAATFDAAVLHGIGAPTGGEFDTFVNSPTSSIATDPYAGMLAAISTVGTAGGDVTEWDMSLKGEVSLLGAKDGNDRPLFTQGVSSDAIGAVLGRPVVRNRNVYKADGTGTGGVNAETLGFAVDWSSQFWGTVEGIQYREYDGPIYQADGTLVHAGAQDNMGSVICEIEVAFRSADTDRVVRLIGADAA